jgi:hypothetical protein
MAKQATQSIQENGEEEEMNKKELGLVLFLCGLLGLETALIFVPFMFYASHHYECFAPKECWGFGP